MTKTEMLNEAIARMKKLDLHPNTIKDLKNGTVNVSRQHGALFWADENEQKIIAKFENEHNALVYHVIYTPTEFGELFSMLFVSQYDEEWELDNEDIDSGYPIAMVVNLTDEWCSDMGSIGVRKSFGGLVRTA